MNPLLFSLVEFYSFFILQDITVNQLLFDSILIFQKGLNTMMVIFKPKMS